MQTSSKTRAALLVLALAAAVIVIVRVSRRPVQDDVPAEAQVSAARSPAPTAGDPASTPEPSPSAGTTSGAGVSGGAASVPTIPPVVDLAALRAKLPDNAYWTFGVPTTDPAEQERRDAQVRAKNQLFGKVQSNTASEPEITEYYAYKRKLVQDYATFARTVLADYGSELSSDERNLYGLAVRMNEQRLKQLPREETSAVERHQAYEARKAAR